MKAINKIYTRAGFKRTNRRYYSMRRVIAFLIYFNALWLIFSPPVLAKNITGKKNVSADYNVIVIVVNALRTDHLGYYGYPRNTSPNIDRLAQEGVFFDRAISQSYWTLPSLVSILTSKYVCAHGINKRDVKLRENEETLPEILKMSDYKTAAFTCGLDTVAAYGLGRGFDVYRVVVKEGSLGTFSDIIPPAIKWLKKNRNKKFFLFLHSYDVHPPYECDAEKSFAGDYNGIIKNLQLNYNLLKEINNGNLHLNNRDIRLKPQDINYIIARYDDSIRCADKSIGYLMDELKRLKLYDKTIIVLCGDHGEELGERGTFNRFGNQNLYQETIRVPLIIKYPSLQLAGRRIHSLVELVDITPTILDLLGILKENSWQQGKSLAPCIKMKKEATLGNRKYVFSEASKHKWAILRNDGWKLVYSEDNPQLYNLNKDPNEVHNLFGQKLGLQLSLKKKFFLWRRRHGKEKGIDNRIVFDSKFIDRLKKAGYW